MGCLLVVVIVDNLAGSSFTVAVLTQDRQSAKRQIAIDSNCKLCSSDLRVLILQLLP